jgi:dienelactone hydrolase
MASFWESIKVDDEDMKLSVSVPDGKARFPPSWSFNTREGSNGPTRRARLRDVTVIKDVNATVDFLKSHPGVDGERLGIVGFCMGGRVAYLMAPVNPNPHGNRCHAGADRDSWPKTLAFFE